MVTDRSISGRNLDHISPDNPPAWNNYLEDVIRRCKILEDERRERIISAKTREIGTLSGLIIRNYQSPIDRTEFLYNDLKIQWNCVISRYLADDTMRATFKGSEDLCEFLLTWS